MTIVIQRWLGVRLDIMGNCLILGICLFAAGFRTTVDPSRIGVVLSYTLSSECHDVDRRHRLGLLYAVDSYASVL